MTNYHLAILKKPYLDAILDGSKKVESRFSRAQRLPFGQVGQGDKIFFKISSGPVCMLASVLKVKNFAPLTPKRIINLKQRYGQSIGASGNYWASKAACKFGTLVWLTDIKPIEPVLICKKDRRAWVILTKERDFGLLTLNAVKKRPVNIV